MADEDDVPADKPKRKLPPVATLVAAGNTLFVVGALGMMFYTKIIFHRPTIIEETEYSKQSELAKQTVEMAESNQVPFDRMTVNLAMEEGKAHFATLAFSIQCRDLNAAEAVKDKRALILDRVISALGHRQLAELNTIQGKLLLKTELMHQFNEIVATGYVTDLYLSDFVLQ